MPKFKNPDFRHTIITLADFHLSDMSSCDLSNADLSGVSLKGAILKGAKFCEANIINALLQQPLIFFSCIWHVSGRLPLIRPHRLSDSRPETSSYISQVCMWSASGLIGRVHWRTSFFPWESCLNLPGIRAARFTFLTAWLKWNATMPGPSRKPPEVQRH